MSEQSPTNKTQESRVYPIQCVETGVDWITVTGETEKSWERVSAFAMHIVTVALERGERTFKQVRNGYRLTCTRDIQFGKGSRGWMVCLSGEVARRFWLSFYAYAKNCSRIDLQTTLLYNDYSGREVQQMYKKAFEDNEGALPTQGTLLQGSNGGATLYIGSRRSEQMGRIYDKQKQSEKLGSYRKCVRFEVEFKGRRAKEVARWLLDKSPTQEDIAAYVLQWFSDRYIPVPQMFTYRIDAIEVEKGVSTNERRLEWLKKTVSPVYRQLKLAGLQTEADEAIGVLEDVKTVNGGSQ